MQENEAKREITVKGCRIILKFKPESDGAAIALIKKMLISSVRNSVTRIPNLQRTE